MRAGVSRLVQVYESGSQVLLNGTLKRRAAIGDGMEGSGANVESIEVL